MPIDKSILGLRFGSNTELQPTQVELRAFLSTEKKGGKGKLHRDDLALYSEMLDRIAVFEQERPADAMAQDFRESIFLGVLRHTSFFSAALRTAVEQYKYQLHALLSLDFRKPTVFIQSAEQEVRSLNPKKPHDAAMIARLHSMIEERKQALETLKRRGELLMEELQNIARYVRDNLVKIKKLCEGSIVILVELQDPCKEQRRLREEIEEYFSARLRDTLCGGQITKECVEMAQNDVSVLSHELSGIMREDLYSLGGLLEAVYDHANKIAGDIDAQMRLIKGNPPAGIEAETKQYEEMERVFLALVSNCRFELRIVPTRTSTAYENILREKRTKMLDHFLELLQKERRVRSDRRIHGKRRKYADVGYEDPERRIMQERRVRMGRRRPGAQESVLSQLA